MGLFAVSVGFDSITFVASRARIFGKRLADLRWVESGRNSGQCFAFVDRVMKSGYRFYIAKEFQAAHPVHAGVLLSASAEARAAGARFFAEVGGLPTQVLHPMLTFR